MNCKEIVKSHGETIVPRQTGECKQRCLFYSPEGKREVILSIRINISLSEFATPRISNASLVCPVHFRNLRLRIIPRTVLDRSLLTISSCSDIFLHVVGPMWKMRFGRRNYKTATVIQNQCLPANDIRHRLTSHSVKS